MSPSREHSQPGPSACAGFRDALAAILLLGSLLSCRTYRPVPQDTIDRGSPYQYSKLLVVTRDGYEIELTRAYIRPDSVVGLMTGGKERRQRVAYAHERIVRIESAELSVGAAGSEATAPPPGADLGGLTRGIICVTTMTLVCVPPPPH